MAARRVGEVRARLAPLCVALAFVAARLWAYQAGLRFDASQWPRFWHFIDRPLLETRLLESLLHLHSQPPLFNLALGLSHRLFADQLPLAWQLAYLACSAALTAVLYRLARVLGAEPWPAALVSAAFCASPAALLYESFLFYTLPVALLIALTAWLLSRCVARPSAGRLLALFGCAALLPLTRALFHPLWLLALVAAVWLVLRAQRPTVLRAAALPCLLVALLPLKNAVLFGQPSTSSWRGMNLARVVLDRMDPADARRMIGAGAISGAAAVGPFEPVARYRAHVPFPAATGIPLLDAPRKHNGEPNLHHRAYPAIARQLERDSLTVIAREPAGYARSVGRNLLQTLKPASSYVPLRPGRARIAPLERLRAATLDWPLGPSKRGGPLLVALPLLLGYGLWLAARPARSAPARAAALFASLTALYVIGVGALLERSENQRFRFTVDPLLLSLAAALLSDLWRRARALRGTRPGA